MKPQELAEVIASIPKPTVDAFHVRSQIEVSLLRLYLQPPNTTNTIFGHALGMGIPVHVVEDTPPMTLRAMLDGEVVDQHPMLGPTHKEFAMSDSPLEPEWEKLGIPVDDDAEPEDADLDDGYEEQGAEDE